jgi:ribosome maturation factor RimP
MSQVGERPLFVWHRGDFLYTHALKELEERLEDLIEPVVEQAGLRLVSVVIVRRGKRLVVTVCLDKEGGIAVDACAEMSEEISRHIDVEGIVEERYLLEVTSPGLERVLRKPREYRCFLGRDVELVLRQPFEGRQKMLGKLVSADDEGMSVIVEGEELYFPYEALKKTKLYYKPPW